MSFITQTSSGPVFLNMLFIYLDTYPASRIFPVTLATMHAGTLYSMKGTVQKLPTLSLSVGVAYAKHEPQFMNCL